MDTQISPALYEDHNGVYFLRGCPNQICGCTGMCKEKIYIKTKMPTNNFKYNSWHLKMYGTITSG